MPSDFLFVIWPLDLSGKLEDAVLLVACGKSHLSYPAGMRVNTSDKNSIKGTSSLNDNNNNNSNNNNNNNNLKKKKEKKVNMVLKLHRNHKAY